MYTFPGPKIELICRISRAQRVRLDMHPRWTVIKLIPSLIILMHIIASEMIRASAPTGPRYVCSSRPLLALHCKLGACLPSISPILVCSIFLAIILIRLGFLIDGIGCKQVLLLQTSTVFLFLVANFLLLFQIFFAFFHLIIFCFHVIENWLVFVKMLIGIGLHIDPFGRLGHKCHGI